MRMILILLPAFALATLPAAAAPVYPEGRSSHKYGDMHFELSVPAGFDRTKTYPLVVALHTAREQPTTLMTDLESVAEGGRIVCAPKSRSSSWSTSEVKTILSLVGHLVKSLPIAQDRLHAIGDGHGGSLVPFLTFAKKSPFTTACFINAGFQGGSIAKDARKRLSVLALTGRGSSARSSMAKIEERLAGKVRTVELRVGRDTEKDWFPRELMPYLCYWLGAMEGRFVPGETPSLDWHEDVDEARDALQRTKAPGALVYFFSSADKDSADAKALQNEVLHDVEVRTPGKALVAVKLERSANEALFASLGLKSTPAVAVLGPDLEPVKTFEGAVKPKALSKVLKGVAKKRRK